MKAKGNGKTCMKRRYWTEEGRKWEIIKICRKREGTDYYWGWRKAGRDDSGRSLITVAKSKGKWNGEMGKMEKHNFWESVANTGMEEIRSTGNPGMWEHAKWRPQLKDTSPQSRMSRMEWGGRGSEHSKRADCQGRGCSRKEDWENKDQGTRPPLDEKKGLIHQHCPSLLCCSLHFDILLHNLSPLKQESNPLSWGLTSKRRDQPAASLGHYPQDSVGSQKSHIYISGSYMFFQQSSELHGQATLSHPWIRTLCSNFCWWLEQMARGQGFASGYFLLTSFQTHPQ